jgi:hypothetical protein
MGLLSVLLPAFPRKGVCAAALKAVREEVRSWEVRLEVGVWVGAEDMVNANGCEVVIQTQ